MSDSRPPTPSLSTDAQIISDALAAGAPLASHPVSLSASASTPAEYAEPRRIARVPAPGAAQQPGAVAGDGDGDAAKELKLKLRAATRHFPDFPIKGIDFVDIMPLFAAPDVHSALLDALVLQARGITTAAAAAADAQAAEDLGPDVIVGLDARGFLFGPGLALRLGAGFAPVRKEGKLPGPCVTAAYEKEYGSDLFQMQADGVRKNQKVLIVDDIIATGGSAKAAADLVVQLGGRILGYLFILEIPGLNGREKLGDVPISILLEDA